MHLASITALFSIQWVLCGIIQYVLHDVNDPATPSRSATPGAVFVESFSPQFARGCTQWPAYHHPNVPIRLDTLRHSSSDGDGADDDSQDLATSPSKKIDITSEESTDIDISSINEAQLLLACRSWLLRKHKLEWKEKKRRAEAAASPLNNEGYFWPDPNDLLYLREDPDPYNLIYNETYGEYYGYKRNGVRFLTSQDTTYSGKNYYDETEPLVDIERASLSTNPFSTNPISPSDEHVRRSKAKMKLWNNETWKEEWYVQRWKGKVSTQSQKYQEKQEKMLDSLPNDILDSPSFDDMSEENVTEAILSYLIANQRKSESRKSNKYKRQKERESFREWREEVKQEAEQTNITTSTDVKDLARKVGPSSNEGALSFSLSVEKMKELKAKRSEKSRQAFQTRLANSKANTSSSSSTKKMRKLRRSYDQENEIENDDMSWEISPMRALLHIDTALDNNRLPSPTDVETILIPGRLGRRRDTLRRILSECFDLRGKCVPSLSGNSDLLFVTKCTIHELGVFVLAKLRQTSSKVVID